MKITLLTNEEFEDFLIFHKASYPTRRDVRERFRFQFLENPLLNDKKIPYIFLAHAHDNSIVGQYGINPFFYQYNGQKYSGYCGCDLIVKDDFKKYGVGGLLSIKAIKSYHPHISIGVSKQARPILESLNMKKVGETNLFLWLRNPFALLKGVADYITDGKISRGKKLNPVHFAVDFPTEIRGDQGVALQVLNVDAWPESFAKRMVFEFSRDVNFMRWRFPLEKGYHIYSFKDKIGDKQRETEEEFKINPYFVVRILPWQGMNLLALIDYRAGYENQQFLRELFQIIKKIARNVDCDGIITLSSHTFYNDNLKRERFFKIGAPLDIYVSNDVIFPEKNVKGGTAALITMADSDLEFAFWPKEDIYD